MRILFQGDSITDAGRKKDGIGNGYVKYAIELLKEKYPDREFEFVNRGISCHKVSDLWERFDRDFLEVEADLVSILIGINDAWTHIDHPEMATNEQFERDYRAILTALKERGTKIVMAEPFVLNEEKTYFYDDLYKKILIERKLAREFADAYLPLDGLLASEWVGREATELSEDGVHPNEEGSRLIARLWVEWASPVIEAMDR